MGLVFDLGSEQDVTAASIAFKFSGDHTTATIYAAPNMSPSTPVSSLQKIATGTTSDKQLDLVTKTPVKTRYVVLWLTAMPKSGVSDYSGATTSRASRTSRSLEPHSEGGCESKALAARRQPGGES